MKTLLIMMTFINTLPLSPDIDKAALEAQISANPRQWEAAVEFLRNNDLMTLAAGRHDITSDGVYANVQEYESKVESSYEIHREYIDIQCVVSGQEYIYVADINDVSEPIGDLDTSKDIQFFRKASNRKTVLADKDNYVILFPNEAHQPCMAIDGKPGHIRKIVVKVPVYIF